LQLPAAGQDLPGLGYNRIHMDVERAVEHLLQLHARAEARMDRAEERMDRAEARMDRFEEQLRATAKLVQVGTKLVVHLVKTQGKLSADVKALTADVKALTVAQSRTEENVNRLVRLWLPKGGNGRPPRK